MSRPRLKSLTATVALVTLLVAASAGAQDKGTEEPRIEPEAVEALKAMGEHLQSMQSFRITARTTAEVVLETDQKLEIGSEATYEVKRPDRLRIDLVTDVVHGELVYDGKTLVYASPDRKVYAQVPAPATIKETLEHAAQKYDLAFPLADLFAWGTPDAPTDLVREGFLVGHAFVNGKETDHWAFRGPDQDAEIWIATEGGALPLKVSLVDRDDMTRPRITTILEWTENAEIADDVFQYKPEEGAEKIRFLKEDSK